MTVDFRRSHTCGELTASCVGQPVTLSGWVNRRRDHGGLIFIDLRDRFGVTQLLFDPARNKGLHSEAEALRSEWVITVKGTVKLRGKGLENHKLLTGEIEIDVSEMELLAKAKPPPFSISENDETNEDVRLRYRYLEIRRGEIGAHLIKRHQAMMAARNYLDRHHFVEISTPILAKSTPEGARDYLVPSRIHPGSFYALPQSPQLFKQLLMIAGMDRYFQIAPCFRDEDLRADRQPEFTQIDLEMSFGNPEDLLQLIEGLFVEIFKETKGITLNAPFKRMTYQECLNRFGTDRPDTRFGMELCDLSDLAAQTDFSIFQSILKENGVVKGIVVKGGADLSRREIDGYTLFVNRLGIRGLAWIKRNERELQSSIVKFFPEKVQKELVARTSLETGDLIFMIADKVDRTHQALDHLRRKLAAERDLIPKEQYHLLWVTDFPLFSWNHETKRYESLHHPFTSPHIEDIHLLDSNPLQVRSYGYDLILNGYEVGGGSQRIHQSHLQAKVFELLGISAREQSEKFGFFLDALQYGTPPHLGIAIGLDRLMMILCQTENIRDVIAFPKTQKAVDRMIQSPAPVQKQQLDELKVKIAPTPPFTSPSS